MLYKKSSSPFWRSPLALLGLMLLIVVLFLVVHFTSLFKDNPHPRTANQYTKGESATKPAQSGTGSANSVNTSTNAPVSTSQKESGNSGVNTGLVTPTGDFVSNHRPSLNPTSPLNLESSVCTTTPGAECKIQFTKDGVTKVLDLQTTDSGGSAYRDWHLQDIGLTEGTWSIQVIASFNGQTKTASDASNLVVSQ